MTFWWPIPLTQESTKWICWSFSPPTLLLAVLTSAEIALSLVTPPRSLLSQLKTKTPRIWTKWNQQRYLSLYCCRSTQQQNPIGRTLSTHNPCLGNIVFTFYLRIITNIPIRKVPERTFLLFIPRGFWVGLIRTRRTGMIIFCHCCIYEDVSFYYFLRSVYVCQLSSCCRSWTSLTVISKHFVFSHYSALFSLYEQSRAPPSPPSQPILH